MAAPCAVVVTCSPILDPDNVIKEIIGVDSLPEAKARVESIEAYPWKISNKYYAADVELCRLPRKTLGDSEFAESVEAIIVLFENKKPSFDEVKTWLPFVREWNPEVRILACNKFISEHDITQHDAQLWCIDNAFELVELRTMATEDSDDEEEDDVNGMKRIISALHAHTWSNLVMKERPNASPLDYLGLCEAMNSRPNNAAEAAARGQGEKADTETKEMDTELGSSAVDKNSQNWQGVSDGQNNTDTTDNDRTCGENNENNSSDKNSECDKTEKADSEPMEKEGKLSKGAGAEEEGVGGAEAALPGDDNKKQKEKGLSHTQRIDSLLSEEDRALYQALGNEDPGETSFEQLFEEFAKMKERAETLPQEERKSYAEKVTIAFWRAMGGDMDEIKGLSSDDDDDDDDDDDV